MHTVKKRKTKGTKDVITKPIKRQKQKRRQKGKTEVKKIDIKPNIKK